MRLPERLFWIGLALALLVGSVLDLWLGTALRPWLVVALLLVVLGLWGLTRPQTPA